MVSYIYTYELTLDSFRLVLTGGLPCAPSTYMGSGDPNSDPHACTASSLTTEPRSPAYDSILKQNRKGKVIAVLASNI